MLLKATTTIEQFRDRHEYVKYDLKNTNMEGSTNVCFV